MFIHILVFTAEVMHYYDLAKAIDLDLHVPVLSGELFCCMIYYLSYRSSAVGYYIFFSLKKDHK